MTIFILFSASESRQQQAQLASSEQRYQTDIQSARGHQNGGEPQGTVERRVIDRGQPRLCVQEAGRHHGATGDLPADGYQLASTTYQWIGQNDNALKAVNRLLTVIKDDQTKQAVEAQFASILQ